MENIKLLTCSNHGLKVTNKLQSLRKKEKFCDATILCSGKFIPVHRFVLSNFSEHFEQIFEIIPSQHPFIILNGSPLEELEALLNYMYDGQVQISEDKIFSLMKLANDLKVKELIVANDGPLTESQNNNEMNLPNESAAPPTLFQKSELEPPKKGTDNVKIKVKTFLPSDSRTKNKSNSLPSSPYQTERKAARLDSLCDNPPNKIRRTESSPSMTKRIEPSPSMIKRTEPLPGMIKRTEPLPGMIKRTELPPGMIKRTELPPGMIKGTEPLPSMIKRTEPSPKRIDLSPSKIRKSELPGMIKRTELPPGMIKGTEPLPSMIKRTEPPPGMVKRIEPSPKRTDLSPSKIRKSEPPSGKIRSEPSPSSIRRSERFLNKIGKTEPSSSKIRRTEPSSSKVRRTELSPNKIERTELSPNENGATELSSNKNGAKEPSPNNIRRTEPSPVKTGRIEPSPNKTGRTEPSPNKTGRTEPSPNKIGRTEPSPKKIRWKELSPSKIRIEANESYEIYKGVVNTTNRLEELERKPIHNLTCEASDLEQWKELDITLNKLDPSEEFPLEVKQETSYTCFDGSESTLDLCFSDCSEELGSNQFTPPLQRPPKKMKGDGDSKTAGCIDCDCQYFESLPSTLESTCSYCDHSPTIHCLPKTS